MILDTNALSAWAEGSATVEACLRSAERLVVPSVVLGEYYLGIRQSRYRSRYEDWLDRYLVLAEIVTVPLHRLGKVVDCLHAAPRGRAATKRFVETDRHLG